MNTKLTLRMDEDLIAAAKLVAAKRNTSLSKMIAEFLKSVTPKQSNVNRKKKDRFAHISPAVRALMGTISAPNDMDDKAEYRKHLEEKYL